MRSQVPTTSKEPGAMHSKMVWTARLQNYSQNYKLLLANCGAEGACQSSLGFPLTPVWPPVSLCLCAVPGQSTKNWK